MNSQSALIPSEHGLVECGLRLITSYNLHWRTTMDILATAYTPACQVSTVLRQRHRRCHTDRKSAYALSHTQQVFAHRKDNRRKRTGIVSVIAKRKTCSRNCCAVLDIAKLVSRNCSAVAGSNSWTLMNRSHTLRIAKTALQIRRTIGTGHSPGATNTGANDSIAESRLKVELRMGHARRQDAAETTVVERRSKFAASLPSKSGAFWTRRG